MAQQENIASLPEAQLSYHDTKWCQITVPSKMQLHMASLAGRQVLVIDPFQ